MCHSLSKTGCEIVLIPPPQVYGSKIHVNEIHLAFLFVSSCRPVTTASGRHVRLGTASMLTEPGGPFIDVSKINLSKYANRPALAKVGQQTTTVSERVGSLRDFISGRC